SPTASCRGRRCWRRPAPPWRWREAPPDDCTAASHSRGGEVLGLRGRERPQRSGDMSIFVDENTKLVVQGLTGGQGRFHGLRNRDYGTKVVAGVTPGKGGSDVDGIPIYDSVPEAVEKTGANASF